MQQRICICNGGQGLFGSDNQKQLAHRGQMITFDKDGEEVEI